MDWLELDLPQTFVLPWIYIVRKNSSSNWLKSLVHVVDCAVLLNITCIRWDQGLLQPNEAWNATHGNAQQGLAKYPWGRHSTWKPLSSVFPHRAGPVVLPLLPDISFFPLPLWVIMLWRSKLLWCRWAAWPVNISLSSEMLKKNMNFEVSKRWKYHSLFAYIKLSNISYFLLGKHLELSSTKNPCSKSLYLVTN